MFRQSIYNYLKLQFQKITTECEDSKNCMENSKLNVQIKNKLYQKENKICYIRLNDGILTLTITLISIVKRTSTV